MIRRVSSVVLGFLKAGSFEQTACAVYNLGAFHYSDCLALHSRVTLILPWEVCRRNGINEIGGFYAVSS